MLPKPYSVNINGTNFKLVKENKGEKEFYYLIGNVKITTEYSSESTEVSQLKIPLTLSAYESLNDGIERLEGSRIDTLGNLELKFVEPDKK